MSDSGQETRVTIIPTLRYEDAAAAIDWLCEAFGFERRMVVPGEGDQILHAQLVFGNGMVMLGSAREDAYGALQKPPAAAGGVTTQSSYVVVHDVEAHHVRAAAAGAEVVMPVEDQGHGTMYSCRDPEGHLWNFGDYDPWRPVPTADG